MINITFLYVFFAWAFFPLIWTNRVHTTRCSINGSRAHANGKVSTAAVAKSLVIFNLASALCVGYSYVGIKFRGKKIYCYTPSIMNMLHSILFFWKRWSDHIYSSTPEYALKAFSILENAYPLCFLSQAQTLIAYHEWKKIHRVVSTMRCV